MITYDWKKLLHFSEGRTSIILDVVNYLTYPDIPEDIRDPILRYAQEDWSGISFIVNPKPMLEYRGGKFDKELAEYVALASFRSLAEYKVTKRTTLLLMEAPVNVESFKDNRFLSVTDKEVKFRWEETTH